MVLKSILSYWKSLSEMGGCHRKQAVVLITYTRIILVIYNPRIRALFDFWFKPNLFWNGVTLKYELPFGFWFKLDLTWNSTQSILNDSTRINSTQIETLIDQINSWISQIWIRLIGVIRVNRFQRSFSEF